MSGGIEDSVRSPKFITDTAGGRDASMADGLTDPTHSPAFQHATQNTASSPRPTRVGTPVRHAPGSAANGERNETGSRAASGHPEIAFTIPNEVPPNGAPVRQYINMKLTGPLLEGMKMIAKEQ
ncbi:dpy-30 protein [Grosmannia clavigera kw1407]|uniref:Dpy-30 protein n=1 Tax=Grosmannia clavigera (strain kw1407 / UAMH 11150) TaxID=655863 RepID=F0XHI1_GROCL|nr:dpy-30 protein [Grosmannia clavigera kw1407]EFX02956.1 dpy-30 protein [Grosmannia clavigera kw1407]